MTLVEDVPIVLGPTRLRSRPGVPEHGPELLPLEPGEQYRFTFDMGACVGCHSCEVACAEQNNTPVDGAWRRVGEVEGGTFPHTRRFSLSIACNHCVEPTCLSGCPTNAYEKLGNGLVVHHAEDCIGCKYCMWNCPYEVPVFNESRKIVSKCDMCRPRLDEGQKPACVLACPTKAIGIEPVNVAAWRADHEGADAPGLPPAAITLSTTRIDCPAGLGAAVPLVAVDDHRVEPEEPHWPLIVLTLLTQLSLGTVGAALVLEAAGVAAAAFVAGAVALAASLLHLGRPDRALKALRNLRTSWLSREVALFSAFSGFSFAYAATMARPLGVLAAASGVAGVYASARLYRVPARPVWNSWRTPAAFFATAASTGPLFAMLWLGRGHAGLITVAAAGVMGQLAVTGHLAAAVRRRPDRQHQGTARLLLDRFRTLLFLRVAAAAAGLGLLGFALSAPLASGAAGGRLVTALAVIALAELAGRYLFYVTVVPYRVAGSHVRRRS